MKKKKLQRFEEDVKCNIGIVCVQCDELARNAMAQ